MVTLTGSRLTLTKASLASELGISIRTLERLRAANVLPPTVAGLRRPRWATETIVEWLKAGGLKQKG